MGLRVPSGSATGQPGGVQGRRCEQGTRTRPAGGLPALASLQRHELERGGP